MALPFTREQFLSVFASYNQAVWPAQVVAYLLCLAVVATAARPGQRSARLGGIVLALFWLVTGVAYHVVYFARINPVATGFGALFVLEAGLLGWELLRPGAILRLQPTVAGLTGAALVAYATIIYPLLGMAAGHGWPRGPLVGLTPCPTAIFTFGALLWLAPGVRARVLVIPTLWAVVGLSAALQLGMREDLALPVSAAVSIVMAALGRGKPAN